MRHVSIFCVLLVCCAVVSADENDRSKDERNTDLLVLKGGKQIHGKILEESDHHVVIRSFSATGFFEYTAPIEDVVSVKRGEGAVTTRADVEPLRDEWFLLYSEGRIVGTRHLELWTVRSKTAPGFRLEENLNYFAQGKHVPAMRVWRHESVDLRFMPRRLAFREVRERSAIPGGPGRFERAVSGDVTDGIWRATISEGGKSKRKNIELAVGTRGRLGLREHLLRREREIEIVDTYIVDGEKAKLSRVRAGFVGIDEREDEDPKPKRDEFHWEQDGERLIAFFHRDTRPHEEHVEPGILAKPVGKEQALAAREENSRRESDPNRSDVKLVEAGIGFRLPDSAWRYEAKAIAPLHTGWRLLGRANAAAITTDARFEWHPEGQRIAPGMQDGETWLLKRLRTACEDLKVVSSAQAIEELDDGWRMELEGTLRGDKVRTVAVVVDRDPGRLVVLLACPLTAWKDGRAAVERFVESIHRLD